MNDIEGFLTFFQGLRAFVHGVLYIAIFKLLVLC